MSFKGKFYVSALYGALPVPYVPVLVTRRYTYAPPRCRTSQYYLTFIVLSVSLCNNLSDPVFDGVGLKGFKSGANAFLLALIAASSLFLFCCFPFLFFHSMGWCYGIGDFGPIGC